MCGGCGKLVSDRAGTVPEQCHDCGGAFYRPTPEDVACDRCGGGGSGQVLGHEDYNRLCDSCLDAVDRGDGRGDEPRADGGMRVQDIADEFVREHAVPADNAESWVHIGLDDHYHPAGGYWFPTGQKWGDASGWVSRKYDIPHGDVIQFPRTEREPEVRGKDDVPDYVVNRTLQPESEQAQDYSQAGDSS